MRREMARSFFMRTFAVVAVIVASWHLVFAAGDGVARAVNSIQPANVEEKQIAGRYWVIEIAATNTQRMTVPQILVELEIDEDHTYRIANNLAASEHPNVQIGNWIVH